jgi:hypothetical protein
VAEFGHGAAVAAARHGVPAVRVPALVPGRGPQILHP